MKYSYNNRSSVKDYRKKIRDGFERFHSMNAQDRVLTFEDTNDPNITILQFVSYDTNIMQVTINHSTNRFIVVCNENPFDWSCSTSRQLSRWLYESRYLPFDADTLRMAYANCNSVTPDVSVYEWFLFTFEFRSSDAFNRIWR